MSTNGSKHTVSTDALDTLGSVIDERAGRDAIHLAVEPAVAAAKLKPGQHVGFVDGGVGDCKNPIGIVDPFLKKPVKKGERFWLVVYPRQITSLRHVWTHPAFDNPAPPPISEADREQANKVAERLTKSSETWLRDFCAKSDCPGYDDVMAVINSGNGVQLADEEDYGKSRLDGDYIHFSGRDAHGDIPPEFWDHVEIVTGKKFENRAAYFSCSC